MKIISRFSTFVLLAAALAGCQTNDVKQDSRLDIAPNEGVAIFSVTHDSDNIARAAEASFGIDGDTTTAFSGTITTNAPIMLSSSYQWNENSDFPGTRGRAYAIPLKAGQHYLGTWYVDNGAGLLFHPKAKPIPYLFDIAAGEVKYLGNLHMKFVTVKTLLGYEVPKNGYPEIRNESKRDIGVIEARYPQLKGRIVSAPLLTGRWVN